MNVGNIHRFEEKLRETEKNLGVKEGINIVMVIIELAILLHLVITFSLYIY